MPATDKAAFTALIAKTWRFYEKTPTAETVADWFDVLEGIPLDAIAIAFKRHLTDPKAGQYLPKPGDIIRQIHAAQPDQGHPGPEEAWGLLLRFANDERETGLYTEPMRQAWEACGPILKAGDEIGARMCFLETYRKALKRAIETRTPPKWSLSAYSSRFGHPFQGRFGHPFRDDSAAGSGPFGRTDGAQRRRVCSYYALTGVAVNVVRVLRRDSPFK